MMNQRTHIPEETYKDDIVRFLADRYHTTPKKIMRCFLNQNESESEPEPFRLEENEMAILRDMMSGNHS